MLVVPRARGTRRKKNLALPAARVWRLALLPANLRVLQAKESLKDPGIGNTLESLCLGRPTTEVQSKRHTCRRTWQKEDFKSSSAGLQLPKKSCTVNT